MTSDYDELTAPRKVDPATIRDPACSRCAYDLTTHESFERCPECGLGIEYALAEAKPSRAATASVWLGITGIVTGIPTFGFLGPPLGIAASILGTSATRRANEGLDTPASATAGTWGNRLGWVSTILGVLAMVVLFLTYF